MTKPITDKAEVAVEYPDKLYIGTFAHTARFDAHIDQTGISLTLELPGPSDQRKSVRMHFHHALFDRPRQLERQRDAGLIDVSVEPCGMRERPDIEFVRIFHRDFGLVGNWFGHDERLLQIAKTIRPTCYSVLIWINRGQSGTS